MAKWDEYALKSSDLSENDEVLILDTETATNKRSIISRIADFVVKKLPSSIFSDLSTEDKTLVGAVNEVVAKNTEQDTAIENVNGKLGGLVFSVTDYGLLHIEESEGE